MVSLAALYMLTACATAETVAVSVAEPVPAAKLTELIYKQVNRCWLKGELFDMPGSRIEVSLKYFPRNISRIIIYARKGFESKPLLELFILPDEGSSGRVDVSRMQLNRSVDGYARIVEKWLAGSEKCHNFLLAS